MGAVVIERLTRGIGEDMKKTNGIERKELITHSEKFFHKSFLFPR